LSHIHVAGTYNVRDLGGLPTLTGQQTKSHRMLRSGNLDKIPVASQEQLLTYGVATIVDIRDEWEVAHYPNVFEHSPHVKYHNLPLLGDVLSNDATWKSESDAYEYLHELYIKYLERCQNQIAKIFTAIADGESITLFHCHAGKDRTGLIAALLLSVVGVANHDIAEDYRVSDTQITHLINEWRQYALQHGHDMERFNRKVASVPQTIIETLHFVQSKYGDTSNYLQTCGVSKASLTQLQEYLVG
jgi:protein-tyrosine phosphatase